MPELSNPVSQRNGSDERLAQSTKTLSSPAVLNSHEQSPHAVVQSSLIPNSDVVQAPIDGLKHVVRKISSPSTTGNMPAMKEPFSGARAWNTQHLGLRFAGDVAAAAAAGGLVAPLISIIDRGIIENASNRASLSSSIKSSLRFMISQPHKFITSRPFLLVFALYGGTYLSANALDTITSTVRSRSPSSVTSGTSKFATTSATNLSLCLYKDSQFTKMFGASPAATKSIPPISYILFAVRDSMTVFASFNLPPLIAPLLPVGAEMEKFASKATIAQFLAPAGIQVFSTPLHLLGLDLYNRPKSEGFRLRDRVDRVLRDWGKSCAARICRIVPAFGVGGVVNTSIRRWWMTGLEGEQAPV